MFDSDSKNVAVDFSLMLLTHEYLIEQGPEFMALLSGGTIEFNSDDEVVVFIASDGEEIGSVEF